MFWTKELAGNSQDFTKAPNLLKNMFGFSAEILILIKYSFKQKTMLGNIKEQMECHDEDAIKVNNITKVSETRKKVQAICFKQSLDNYAALWNLWQYTPRNENLEADVKSCIIGNLFFLFSFWFFIWFKSAPQSVLTHW